MRASIRPAYDAITSSLVSRIVELTFSRPATMTLPANPETEAAGPGMSAAAAAEAAGPPTHHNRISALLAERQDTAAVKVAAGGLQVRSKLLSPVLCLAEITSARFWAHKLPRSPSVSFCCTSYFCMKIRISVLRRRLCWKCQASTVKLPVALSFISCKSIPSRMRGPPRF